VEGLQFCPPIPSLAKSRKSNYRRRARSVLGITERESLPIPRVDTGTGVPMGTSGWPSSMSSSSLLAIVRGWYRTSVLLLLLAEPSSRVRRMGRILEIRAWERRGYMGLLRYSPDRIPSSVARPDKHACMRHTLQIHSRHPFLSVFDLFLVEQAWLAGSESNSHSCTLQNQNF
jgi:hypothetical protein